MKVSRKLFVGHSSRWQRDSKWIPRNKKLTLFCFVYTSKLWTLWAITIIWCLTSAHGKSEASRVIRTESCFAGEYRGTQKADYRKFSMMEQQPFIGSHILRTFCAVSPERWKLFVGYRGINCITPHMKFNNIKMVYLIRRKVSMVLWIRTRIIRL